MVSLSYREAVSEVLEILKHTKKEDVEKIPQSFIDFLEENKAKNYYPKLDHSKLLKDMNLKPKTLAILGIIYTKYYANAEEKNKFMKKTFENQKIFEKKQRIKYNPNNIF